MQQPQQYQLNVVLHGTWGIENNLDGIRIVTVDDHHHTIKAGDAVDPEFDLRKRKVYRLEGVAEGAPQPFNADQNPTVDSKIDFPTDPDRKIRADEAKVKVIIDLPYPKHIHSVRRAPTNGHAFFLDNFPRTPPEIADVQVLVYDVDVQNIEQLHLGDSGWKPELNPDGRTINLHLFATPDRDQITTIKDEERDPTAIKHFVKVFRDLGHAFGLEMTPLHAHDVPLKLEAEIEGLDACDMASLFERRKRAAVSPANCSMLVLNNLHSPPSSTS